MSSRTLGAALVLTLAAVIVPAARQLPKAQQAPPVRDPSARTPANAPTPTGVLAGTVVTGGDTGQVVRRARITLTAPGLPTRTLMSDAHGAFRFQNLAAGAYTLNVSKAGHVSAVYGQKRPGNGGAGTPIALAENQQIKELAVPLPRGGAITGIVVDENTDHAAGTPVRAMRFVWRDGERTLIQAGTGTTDDRGVYRIFGLPPGDYVVSAVPRPAAREEMAMMEVEMMKADMAKAAAVQPEILTRATAELEMRANSLMGEGAPTEGYAAVYFPGTTASSSAATVLLGVSEERSGIDFQLQVVPLARVEGVVLGPSGQPQQGTTVQLVNTSDLTPGLSTISTRTRPDGQFSLTGVTPGQYLLVARATQPRAPAPGGATPAPVEFVVRGDAVVRAEFVTVEMGQGIPIKMTAAGGGTEQLWATTEIAVDGRPVAGVALNLQPGVTMSGQLIFNGEAPRPPDLAQLRLSLGFVRSPAMAAEIPAPQPARIGPDGRFTIAGILPGRYRFVSIGGATGPLWRMGSAEVHGRDSLDFPFDVKLGENIDGVTITLTDKATELSGTLRDADGKDTGDYTVVLFPSDRQFWTPHSRRVFGLRPSTDGRFAQRTLAHGEYLLAAVDDVEPGAWLDPKFLERLVAAAIRVTIGAGEKKMQDVRVGR